MYKISEYRTAIWVGIIVFGILLFVGVIGRNWMAPMGIGDDHVPDWDMETDLDDISDTSDKARDDIEITEQNEVVVYISGAVHNRGVYSLKSGSRVHQVIDKAGGETEEAKLELLNLAAPLKDGEHIHIPGEDDDIDLNIGGEDNSPNSDLVNINTSSTLELEGLPGIGPVRAKSIMREREENGFYTSKADIKRVSGIGDGIYQQVKAFITVD